MKNSRKYIVFLALLLSLSNLFAQGIRTKVNKGNEEYKNEKYEDALVQYKDALLDDPLHEVAIFNEANAQYKLKKYEDAIASYQKLAGSSDINLASKSYYNIGNAQFQLNKLQESIDAYKRALELNPDDRDAKHNLEIARAKLKENAQKQQQQQQQQDQQQDQEKEKTEPSEYAKQIKARAEQLVMQQKYSAAYQLMQEGMQKDETVKAYQDFTQRIVDIVNLIGV